MRRDICGSSGQHWCILACLKGREKCPQRSGSGGGDGGSGDVGYTRDDRRDQSAGSQRSNGWSEFEVFYGLRQVRQLHILYLLRYIHILHGRDSTRWRCRDSRLHTPHTDGRETENGQIQEDSVNASLISLGAKANDG